STCCLSDRRCTSATRRSSCSAARLPGRSHAVASKPVLRQAAPAQVSNESVNETCCPQSEKFGLGANDNADLRSGWWSLGPGVNASMFELTLIPALLAGGPVRNKHIRSSHTIGQRSCMRPVLAHCRQRKSVRRGGICAGAG